MWEGHTGCQLTNMQAKSDGFSQCPMLAGHFAWQILPYYCLNAKGDVGSTRLITTGKICAQVIGDEGISWLASAKQYAIYDIAWRRSHPDDAHTPKLMNACLGRCCLWLTNIAFLKLIGFFLIFPMLADKNNTLSKHTRHDRYKSLR